MLTRRRIAMMPPTDICPNPQDLGPPIDEQKTLVLVRRIYDPCLNESICLSLAQIPAARIPNRFHLPLLVALTARPWRSQVNTFVIQTTAMLNTFSAVAERKLEAVHRRVTTNCGHTHLLDQPHVGLSRAVAPRRIPGLIT
jgi:hypothetical protein